MDYHRRICPGCGHVLEDNSSKFCLLCGNDFTQNPSLIWGDTDKFYRMCTHCGTGYVLDKTDFKICQKCGSRLDLTPRTEPKLTAEEQQAVDAILAQEREQEEKRRKAEEERIAAERKQREEIRLKLEAEEKERQEELARIAAEKKRKRKIVLTVIGCVFACVVVAVLVFAGVWKYKEKDFIAQGDTALAQGDYDTAIAYYQKVFPLGANHSLYEQKIDDITTAVNIFNGAENLYEQGEYISAMDKANKALAACDELTLAKDLYTKAQDELAGQLQGMFDDKKYAELYTFLAGIDEKYRSETITNIAAELDGVIQFYLDNGNAYIEAGNYAGAVECADALLDINPDNTDAQDIKTKAAAGYVSLGRQRFNDYDMDGALSLVYSALNLVSDDPDATELQKDINEYNTYIGYLEKSAEYYGKADYTNAIDYSGKVPSDTTAGKMALGQYETYMNKLNHDSEYWSDPISISNIHTSYDEVEEKGSFGYWTTTVYQGYENFTLTNHLSRSVEVTIFIQMEKNAITDYGYVAEGRDKKLVTFTLAPNQSVSEKVELLRFKKKDFSCDILLDYNIL
jgi:tetratricopeptide (TPR) repeat protein